MTSNRSWIANLSTALVVVVAVTSACEPDGEHGEDASAAGAAGAPDTGSGGEGGSSESGAAGGASGGEGVSSNSSSCAEQHRSSAAGSTCGSCLLGYIDDGGTCVAAKGCGSTCAEGDGCYEPSGECFTCDHPPTCAGEEGQTGRLLIRKGKDGAECLCETEPGYYLSTSSHAAAPCDADGDGWVSQAAQAALDGNDVALRLNSRCQVLTINSVVLENEAGGERSLALDPPLPLYESVLNDGGPGTPHPDYGAGQLPAAVLNSLTKACVSPVADFNENGAPDVSEWADVQLGSDLGWSDALAGYFAKYARFAYYLELFDGWYEDVGGGAYRIVERQRSVRNGRGLPVVYSAQADDFWQSCSRRIEHGLDLLQEMSTTKPAP